MIPNWYVLDNSTLSIHPIFKQQRERNHFQILKPPLGPDLVVSSRKSKGGVNIKT